MPTRSGLEWHCDRDWNRELQDELDEVDFAVLYAEKTRDALQRVCAAAVHAGDPSTADLCTPFAVFPIIKEPIFEDDAARYRTTIAVLTCQMQSTADTLKHRALAAGVSAVDVARLQALQ
jgi:hypothetical protein